LLFKAANKSITKFSPDVEMNPEISNILRINTEKSCQIQRETLAAEAGVRTEPGIRLVHIHCGGCVPSESMPAPLLTPVKQTTQSNIA